MTGRPSKYNEQTIGKVQEYMECYEELGDVIPSIAGLAVFLEVARDTVHAWRHDKEKEGFSDILDQLLARQEKILFAKGLTNDFNATIVKLALGKHGYSDKAQTELTGADGGPIETDNTFTIEIIRPED